MLKGDVNFIRIKGTFLINGDNYWERPYEIDLYGCPKCGTVRLHPQSL